MRFWLLILQDVTLGSDSSCSCHWYLFNLSLLGWNPGEQPQPQTSGIAERWRWGGLSLPH